MSDIKAALALVADALDQLPEDVYPNEPYKLGRPGSRDVIDATLRDAVQRTGMNGHDVYRAIREAISPRAQTPVADIVQLFGRARVVPTLRERFS